MLDIGVFDPVHVILTADYVKNLAFDKQKICRRTRLSTPIPEMRHTWSRSTWVIPRSKIGMTGRRSPATSISSDAVLDAFTDSDFYLGGTNARGWILGANYGVAKNTWCTLRWMSANEIKGPPLGIDVLFLDLNVKF